MSFELIKHFEIPIIVWIYVKFNDNFYFHNLHGKMEYWNNGIMVKTKTPLCPDQR